MHPAAWLSCDIICDITTFEIAQDTLTSTATHPCSHLLTAVATASEARDLLAKQVLAQSRGLPSDSIISFTIFPSPRPVTSQPAGEQLGVPLPPPPGVRLPDVRVRASPSRRSGSVS